MSQSVKSAQSIKQIRVPITYTSRVVVKRLRQKGSIDIEVIIDNDGIYITVALDKYLEYIVDLVGNPALLVTKSQLHNKIKQASEQVTQLMKDASMYNKSVTPS